MRFLSARQIGRMSAAENLCTMTLDCPCKSIKVFEWVELPLVWESQRRTCIE